MDGLFYTSLTIFTTRRMDSLQVVARLRKARTCLPGGRCDGGKDCDETSGKRVVGGGEEKYMDRDRAGRADGRIRDDRERAPFFLRLRFDEAHGVEGHG